jgi:hypothetical protein
MRSDVELASRLKTGCTGSQNHVGAAVVGEASGAEGAAKPMVDLVSDDNEEVKPAVKKEGGGGSSSSSGGGRYSGG